MIRILVVHNRYQQAGGEDRVVSAEIAMLRSMGHEVDLLQEDNDAIVSPTDAVSTAFRCVYSFSAARDIRGSLKQFRPDLVHIHNFFPRLSPSVHYACHAAGIPVVQTLHNYRLLCPGSTFFRSGKLCEECMGKAVPWPAVQHSCYRQSRSASAAVTGMLSVHRACGTWTRTVSRFIALTAFARNKFIEGGLQEQKIAIKPNFLHPDPGMGPGDGGYALFVGRLSPEKGIDTLLSAWKLLSRKWPLKIVGDGPLASSVRDAIATSEGIQWLGYRTPDEVSSLMARATILAVPSAWYEGFPLVLAEALAAGLPIIASRLGSMAEIVRDGVSGMLITPGRADELSRAVEWIFSHPEQLKSLRQHARSDFTEKYALASNYNRLLDIYGSAMQTVRPIGSTARS